MTINARSEADLDTAAIKKVCDVLHHSAAQIMLHILQQVAKASGAAYSVHKEKATEKFANTPAAPVVGAYQNPFKAEGTASSQQREQFWQSQEVFLFQPFAVLLFSDEC